MTSRAIIALLNAMDDVDLAEFDYADMDNLKIDSDDSKMELDLPETEAEA